jgi:hypothetical protein
MLFTTSDFINLIGNFGNINWCRLIRKGPKTKLALLSTPTGKQSSCIIDESRVLITTINLFKIRSIVALKVNHAWTKNDSHVTAACITSTTLAVIVTSPRISGTCTTKNN